MTKLGTTIADANWRLVGTEGDPHAQGFSLTRETPFLDASVMDLLYEAIRETDEVTTPQASSEDGGAVDYSGTYVVSEVSGREDSLRQNSIRQTLTKVVRYVTGEGEGETPSVPTEAHARLTRGGSAPDSDVPGVTLTREWNFINPADSEDSMTLLRAVETYTDPKAENIAYTGTWWQSKLELVRENDQTHTLRQILTLTASDLHEEDAVLVEFTGTPDSDEEGITLVREWRYILQTAADTLVVGQNEDESVVDPKADGQAYTATFANSSARAIKQPDGTCTIRQTLTQTVSYAAADPVNVPLEAGAVLISAEGDPAQSDYVITREWRYLLDTNADVVFTTLNAVKSYADPQADGQTYTGTFAVTTIAPQKQADRTVIIRQVLTLVSPLDDTLPVEGDLPTPVLTRDEKVLQPFSIEEGTENVIVNRYQNLKIGDESNLELLDIAGPDGYSEKDRRIAEQDNNTLTMDILYRKVAWDNEVDEDSGVATRSEGTQISNKGADTTQFGVSKVTTTVIDGIPIVDAATSVTLIAANPTSGYVSQSAGYSDSGDGNARITTREEKYNVTATTSTPTGETTTEEGQAVSGQKAYTIKSKRKILTATADAIISANVGWNVPDGHVLIKLSKVDHEGGLSSVFQLTRNLSSSVDDDSEDEGRYAWITYGSTIMYRQNPVETETLAADKQQVRYHYERVERLYTSSEAHAHIWANKDSNNGKVGWPGGSASGRINTLILVNMGDSGKHAVVWGSYKEREKGDSKYVSLRCTQDLWTAWVTAKDNLSDLTGDGINTNTKTNPQTGEAEPNAGSVLGDPAEEE